MAENVAMTETFVNNTVSVSETDGRQRRCHHGAMPHFLKEWREFRGLTLEEVGAAAGTSRGQVHKLENKRSISTDWLDRLAKPLDCDAADLLKPPPASEVNFAKKLPVPPPEDDVPVWGRVKGGRVTDIIDTSERAGWTERPRSLADVADAAGAYVPGESMIPRYEPGELVIMNPGKPITKGCYVLVEFEDRTAVIKRWLRGDDNKIVVEQLNPPEPRTYKRAEVRNVFRIIRGGEE